MRAAVVGLGKMGTALSRRLLAQGVELVVWNRSAQAADLLANEGAFIASDLASVWRQSDAVFTFLADDEAVRAVCLSEDGLLNSAPSGALLLEMSTISPQLSVELARRGEERGVRYLRCPVSGNPDVLVAGNLTLIVSGPRDAFESASELLGLVGSKVRYVGDGEAARTLKLAINLVLAANAEAYAEAILLSESSGIDRTTVLDVFGESVISSPFLAYKRKALVDRQYSATFTTAMLLKDLDLAKHSAQEAGVRLPVTELIAELASESCDEGFGDLDFLALLPHLQLLAGLPTDVPRRESSS